MVKIEIESRGPVNAEDRDRIVEQLKARGTFKKRKERILIDYSTLLDSEGIEGRSKDIRVRTTNGQSEIITKIGAWGGDDSRKEYSLMIDAPFDMVVQTYHILGYSKGVLCVRNSDIFDFDGVEIAIVEVPGHSYFFEAEIEVDDEEEAESARRQISDIITQLGLTTFTDDEFFAYIKVLNKEANEVFDAKEASETYFADRFGV